MARSIAPAKDIEVCDRRLIISPALLAGDDGRNINGPSLIRAPAWFEEPLGRYYLYFAHHNGTYIRLATADRLEGPWQVRSALDLSQVPDCRGHIASPDVHVDDLTKTIRLYFHGIAASGVGQQSYVAISPDGLNFEPKSEALGPSYFRVFRYEGFWFSMAKGGGLYRSIDGLTNFEVGRDAFRLLRKNARYNRPGSVRHVAIDVIDERADIYFSRIGDNPERIHRARMNLTGSWLRWRAKDVEEIARPETDWEGGALPPVPSRSGRARNPVRQLRDPGIFIDDDGFKYLLYSTAGEQGIAIARLNKRNA